jgi:hypothetical protein
MYHWENKYYNSIGWYAKFGFDKKLFEKNNWSVFLPFGLSYINQSDKYYTKGGESGCFGGYSADELRVNTKQHVNIYAGIAIQYQNLKWRFAGNLLFNNCLMTGTKAKAVPFNSSNAHYYSDHQLAFNIFASSQLSVLFNVKKNVWLGPSCELFFGNVLSAVSKIKNKINKYDLPEDSGLPYNLTGKNIWINPGIKLQIDLK